MGVEQIAQKTGGSGRSSRAPRAGTRDIETHGRQPLGQFHGDMFGIVSDGAARRIAFARHIIKRPYLPPQTTSPTVTVNCRTGERTIASVPPPAAIIVQNPSPRPYVFKSQVVRRAVMAVAATWHVRAQDLMSASRRQEIVLSRFACFRILRQLKWSTPQIGTALHRDHTTVLAGLERAKELWRHNKDWRAKYDAAWTEFKGAEQP